MTTVIETLRANGNKLYTHTGDLYGKDNFSATGNEIATALENINYGQEENSGNEITIVVDGQSEFCLTEVWNAFIH